MARLERAQQEAEQRLLRQQQELEKKIASMPADEVKLHNNAIAVHLEDLAKLYNAKGDHWRSQTFNRAARLVRGHTIPLFTGLSFFVFCELARCVR